MTDPFKDFELINIDPGDEVLCDLCNKSWKGLPDSGGYVFMSKAVCPDCADEFLKGIKKYNEEKYIKATCLPDCSFYDFVMQYRKDSH